jgi:hypothetical protein
MSFEPALPTSPETLALTREEASAKLVEMQQQLHPLPPRVPSDAQGARHRLEALTGDARWSKALMNGEPAATKEFHDLVALSAAGDDVGDAIVGIQEQAEPIFETTINGSLPRRIVAQAVNDFRNDGLDDGSIAQAMHGGSVSVGEYRAAEALLNARKADPVWVKALMSGDHLAKKEWSLLTVILACDVANPK